MADKVTEIITAATVDAHWSRHAALCIAYADNPELRTNRKHLEAMARAEADFKAAALALDRKERGTTQ